MSKIATTIYPRDRLVKLYYFEFGGKCCNLATAAIRLA